MPLLRAVLFCILFLLLSPAAVCLGLLLDIVGMEEVSPAETDSYPWRAIGVLSFGDQAPHCTAFLTGPAEIRTNTHCIIDKVSGIIHSNIRFILFPHDPDKSRFIKVKTDKAIYDRQRKEGQNNSNPIPPNDIERLDYAILEIEDMVGEEVGYFGISYPPTVQRSGKIRTGFRGTAPNKVDPCKGSCRYDQDPLAHYLAELKNGQQITTGVRTDTDSEARPKSCMAGFPNVSWPSIMLRSQNCGLSGLGDGAPAHNCESDQGGSGSPLFVVNRQCEAIAFAMHTGTRKTTIYYAPDGSDRTLEITYFNYNRSVLMSDENPDPQLESILNQKERSSPNR